MNEHALLRLLPLAFFERVAATVLIAIFAIFASVGASNAQYNWLVNIDDAGFDPAPAGAVIEYTVLVNNAAFIAAPATTVTVDIPPNAEYIGASGGMTNCSAAPVMGPASITCDVPALAASGLASMVLSVQSSVAGVLILSSSVPVANDTDTANNVEPEETTIYQGSDLSLSLSVPPTAVSGDYIDVDVQITNNGPDTANSFEVFFPAPTGLTNITPPSGCSLSGGNYTCLVSGPLLNGNSTTITFIGQVAVGGGSTITSSASVINSDPGDGDATNNDDLGDTVVTAGSDVEITKTRSPSGTLLVGDAVTFTLDASYTGDVPNGLVILDTIPVEYAIQSVTAPGWSCSVVTQTVTCTRASGTVAGENVSLGSVVIETTTFGMGSPTNTATISSVGPADPNLGNNSDNDGSVTILPPIVDLSARKTGPSPALAVANGAEIRFRLSTRNEGTAGFYGTITMVDSVPNGMTVNSVTPRGWSCATLPAVGPTTFTCTITYTQASPLAAGSRTPEVDAFVTVTAPGVYTNTIDVSSVGNLPDNNTANDTGESTVTVVTGPLATDVGAIKTASQTEIISGAVMIYNLEITNAGPVSAENVVVTDRLRNLLNNSVGPNSGLVSVVPDAIAVGMGTTCSSTSAGSAGRNLTCNIPTLTVCTTGVDCPVITVTVRVGGNAANRNNRFSAVSQDTPDSDLSNNSDRVDFTVTAMADMNVTKTANPDPIAAGQDLTYVVTARNIAAGMSDAQNVVITDTLPDSMTFVSATPSSGSCSTVPVAGSVTLNSQIICELGTVRDNQQQTVTIVLRPNLVTDGTIITNDVVVTTTTPETDYTNNDDTVSVTVEQAVLDILVNKTDSVDPLFVGDETVYTVTVHNSGPSASENIVATDLMPTSKLAYISHVVSGAGTCSVVPTANSLGGTLVCHWPYLASGDSETIEITALGIESGASQNNVAISSDEIIAGLDLLAANNQTSEITTVRARVGAPNIDPDTLSLTKTTPVENVIKGAIVPYTITVGNGSASLAGPLDIVDTLPPGMVYVAGSATYYGAPTFVEINGAVITWPNIVIPAMSSVVVTLEGRILNSAPAGEFVNGVVLVDPVTGAQILERQTAVVRTPPETVFDCGDIIGKVFDDRNGNGYQDPEYVGAVTDQTYYGGKGEKLDVVPAPTGEPGIPAVRLVTVNGLVITTDEFGRYNVPCAALPDSIGSNFILKLDTRSLPSGFAVTTENPRVVRMTPGLMNELNFGATLGRVARVDINDAGFDANGSSVAALSVGLGQLAESIDDSRTAVIITYHVEADADAAKVAQARQRLEQVKHELNDVWRDSGRGSLSIQTLIAREAQ